MPRQKQTDEPQRNVRDVVADIDNRVVKIETDVQWIKRGMLGLYAIFAALAAGVVFAASRPQVVESVLRHLPFG